MFPFQGDYYHQICNFNLFQNSPFEFGYLPISPIYFINGSSISEHCTSITQPFEESSPEIAKALPQNALQYKNDEKKDRTTVQEQELLSVQKDCQSMEQMSEEPKQKFGRNICSNIFHLMVKFVKKQKKMRGKILKIIQSNNMTVKVHQFYQIIKHRSYKLKAYVSLLRIKEFWIGPVLEAQFESKNQKEVQCSRIFRIIGRHYLTYCHFPYVFSSKKIRDQSKKFHMQAIRRILSL